MVYFRVSVPADSVSKAQPSVISIHRWQHVVAPKLKRAAGMELVCCMQSRYFDTFVKTMILRGRSHV